MDDYDVNGYPAAVPAHYARFPVIKTNRRGQRQARVLELNSSGLMNRTRSNAVKWKVSKDNVYSMANSGKNIQLTVLFRYTLKLGSSSEIDELIEEVEEIKKRVNEKKDIDGKEVTDYSNDKQQVEERPVINSIDKMLSMSVPPSAPLPLLSDFKMLGELGRVSFGYVLLVKYRPTRTLYAMKILNKTMVISSHQETSVLMEYYILLRIRHPFLVHLSFAFQNSINIHFVMTFARGGELFARLKSRGRVTEEEAVFYIAEIVSTLGYLHDLDIVYKNLNPKNILLAGDGHVLLTNFGLIKEKVEETVDDHTTAKCDNPVYMAPEVLNGYDYGYAADWWSLGVVVYEMFFGVSPFNESIHQKCDHDVTFDAITIPPGRDPEVNDFISSLLTCDAKARLGANGVKEIKSHSIFRSIDFEALERKEIEPPFIPTFNDYTTSANLMGLDNIMPSPTTDSIKGPNPNFALIPSPSTTESRFSKETFADVGWASKEES